MFIWFLYGLQKYFKSTIHVPFKYLPNKYHGITITQMQVYISYIQYHAIITVFYCNHFFFLENEMHKTESRYRNGQTHFLFYHPQRRVGVKRWKTICHRPAPAASQIQLTTQHIERLTAVRVANISQTHTHKPSFQSLIAASYYRAA